MLALRHFTLNSVTYGALSLTALCAVYLLPVSASTFGEGSFGSCEFGSCTTLTLNSDALTTIDIPAPTSDGRCTTNSSDVSVETNSSTGYSLYLSASTTETSLVSSQGSLPTTDGNADSPITLANNRWGYRVDNFGNFGPGTTTAQSNVTTLSQTYAAIVASNQPPDIIANTDSPASPAETTKVWYAACAQTSIPSGSYSAIMTYTALTN